MSLHPPPLPPVPEETARVARTAFPHEDSGHNRAFLYAKGCIAGQRQVSQTVLLVSVRVDP
jgi:hypothetical protein